MKIIKLNSNTDRDLILRKIGSTEAGRSIMREKMSINLLYLKDIKTPAANILKQDALSIGAELAVEKDTILCKDEKIDALLIANDKQLKLLSKKELIQPFGLKDFAKEIVDFIKEDGSDPEIMGVINANDDSFYTSSRFKGDDAIKKVFCMIEEGADIIDIGAVSSRPGSESVSEEDELNRIKPIIDELYKQRIYESVRLSLDSYQPEVVKYALDHGFKIVNDITGLSNDRVAKLVSDYHIQIIIMHMRGSPRTMQNDPKYENVILDIEEFFSKRVKKAEEFGIKDIVLDVGIGFGKSLKHNLLLIKHLSHFKKFNLPILIGASRKSMIDKLSPSTVDDRLAGTLALHLKAVEEGASIVRCHDVKEHVQAFRIIDALKDTYI